MQKGKRLCNDLASPDLTKADIFRIKGNTKYSCFLGTVNMTGFLIYNLFINYLTPYELLFGDIKELSVDDSILERVKVDMEKIYLSSFENFKFKDELNITPDELKALKDLSSRKDIIIQKADKGNSVVILNKRDYIERMTEMLSDIDKLKKLNVKPGKELNLLLKHEDKLVSFLKSIKKSIGENLYKSIYPQGSQPGIMYGSSKIHKPLVNGFPKLRPILSALNTGNFQ